MHNGEFHGVEALEARRMLAATLSGTVLSVAGGNGADTILISRSGAKLNVKINGVTQSFAAAKVQSLKIDAKGGNDTITLNPAGGALPSTTSIIGGTGNDSIYGGNAGELINAGAGDDVVRGGGGNDSIVAGAGNDSVDGGGGNDFIQAGGGNDSVTGGAGDDLIYGDAGNDTLKGEAGNDTLGGDDEDQFVFAGVAIAANVVGDDSLDGGDGDDWLLGGTGNAVISDSNGKDTMTGGPGADILDSRGGDDDITDRELGTDIVPSLDIRPVSKVTHTHSFVHIRAKVNGQIREALIPADIGFWPGGLSAIHTHDDVPKIHFESANTGDSWHFYELFRNWGISFDSHHIGRFVASPGHPITMTVNGAANTQFQDFQPGDLADIVIKVN